MKYFAMFLLIGSTALFLIVFKEDKNNEEDYYNKTLKIINEYEKTLAPNKIIMNGYGLHAARPDKIYDGKIHTIDLSYSVDKRLQYKEARALFYWLADGLLAHLNSNESICSYFYHYPLTYEDLRLSLSFDYGSKGNLKNGDVDSIHVYEGQIMYFIVEHEEIPPKMIMEEVSPEMFVFQGFSKRTCAYKRTLPEEGDHLDQLPEKPKEVVQKNNPYEASIFQYCHPYCEKYGYQEDPPKPVWNLW